MSNRRRSIKKPMNQYDSQWYKNQYIADLIFLIAIFQLVLLILSSKPQCINEKHNVTADEVLSTSKTSHSWMTALLNPVVHVFMMEGTPEPDREKSALNTTPTSTPRQPRLVSSSQHSADPETALNSRPEGSSPNQEVLINE